MHYKRRLLDYVYTIHNYVKTIYIQKINVLNVRQSAMRCAITQTIYFMLSIKHS